MVWVQRGFLDQNLGRHLEIGNTSRLKNIAFYILPYYFHIIQDVGADNIAQGGFCIPHMRGAVQRAEAGSTKPYPVQVTTDSSQINDGNIVELRTQKFTTALCSYCNKGVQKIGSASVITLSFIGLCDFSHILSNTSTIIDGISSNKVVAQMFGRRTVNQSTNKRIVESQAFLHIS